MTLCGYEIEPGRTCKRPAGWGTESDLGHCRDHAEDYAVPRKMKDDVVDDMIDIASMGAKKQDIAAYGGITAKTLREWLNRGERHVDDSIDSPFKTFYVRFQRARAEGAKNLLADSSAEFILQSSYGYTKRQAVEHSSGDGLKVSSKVVTVDES
jgi:hypothetical protein